MTGSIPDPRLEAALQAVGAHFQHDPEWYREGVACAIAAADAHDEASGVRRVTAQQLAGLRADERQRCEARLIGGVRASERSDAERDLLVGWINRVFSVLAADSPVGGVS